MSILRTVALLSVVLWSSGCGRTPAPKPVEPLAPVHADAEGNVPLPEGFPADAPRYPGARVAAASAIHPDAKITLKTTDDSAKVHDFYTSALASQGWVILPKAPTSSTAFEARKEGRPLEIEIQSAAGVTTIEMQAKLSNPD